MDVGETKSTAKIGTEKVIINKERNAKECFTAIRSCTLNKLYFLLIVSKSYDWSIKGKINTFLWLNDIGSCIVWCDVLSVMVLNFIITLLLAGGGGGDNDKVMILFWIVVNYSSRDS